MIGERRRIFNQYPDLKELLNHCKNYDSYITKKKKITIKLRKKQLISFMMHNDEEIMLINTVPIQLLVFTMIRLEKE